MLYVVDKMDDKIEKPRVDARRRGSRSMAADRIDAETWSMTWQSLRASSTSDTPRSCTMRNSS